MQRELASTIAFLSVVSFKGNRVLDWMLEGSYGGRPVQSVL